MTITGSRKIEGEEEGDGSGSRTAMVLVALVIAALTLSPARSATPPPSFFCFGCSERWLADDILNLGLFFPFGLAAAWNGRTVLRATLLGLLLSTVIELAQTVVPGRDPALSDIVFNTIGTACGAIAGVRKQLWLRPSNREATILAALGTLAAAAVMIATAVLLSPNNGGVWLGRSGDDISLQYESRAGSHGLDQPEYWLRNQMHGVSGVESIAVSRDRQRWRIEIPGASAVMVGPTVGRGWTILAYPNAAGQRWTPVLNALWMFMLCLPIGFWARGRMTVVTVVVLAVIVALVPELAGIAATSAIEWVGAAAGFLAGVAARVWTKGAHALRREQARA
jgi:glycopeptide antibiotics resistance protein